MTAAHQPDGDLPAARQRLTDAITTLTDPRTEPTDNGHAEVPPLYVQLYDAIPGAQGTGHSPARSMPPMWLDAARLYAWIDTSVRKWQNDYDKCTHCKHCSKSLPAIRRLETMAAKRWRPRDCALILDYASQLEAWTIEIDLLLTPQHVKHVAAACPSCGHKTALRRDSAGEMVRVPALQIIAETGCTCVVCKATWGPQLYMHLSRVLGFDLPEGVLE